MMDILVVGGAGYIGAHACKALAGAGYRPIVFDNFSSGHEHAVLWGPHVKGDIRNRDDLEKAFVQYRPKGVMHFAACIEVGEGERNPLKFWDNNVAGTTTLLSVMQDYECHNIVFSSTCATYGEPKSLPITEYEPQTPTSVYGRTKLAVEQILSDVSRAQGLRYAALRYFNAAGASPDGEIGEEHDPETHLIPNALKAASGIGSKMKLFGDDYDTPDGTCVRDYIHVMDLAEAHVSAIDRLIKGSEPILCNLGTGRGFSVKEILSAVSESVGTDVPFEIHPRRPGDVSQLYADISYAREILGFRPKYLDPLIIVEHAWKFHSKQWNLNWQSNDYTNSGG